MRFIDEHRDRYAVALLLRVLNIAESTYYQWVEQAEQPSDRDLVDLGLILADPVTQRLRMHVQLLGQPFDHRLGVRLPVQPHRTGA